jgi:hypothetical protein
MKAQVDDLPTQSKSAREHLWLWYGSTLPSGALLVLGRLDGRLTPPRIPLPHPSGRLFGCGLDAT